MKSSVADAKQVKSAFFKVKCELDDHRDAINRNTEELQAFFDYVLALERRVEKLSERLDDGDFNPVQALHTPLSVPEQQIFLLLYASDLPVSLVMMCKRLQLSSTIVHQAILSLLARGIPLLQETEGKNVCFAMEMRFKELQAKRQVVTITPAIAKQFSALKK